MLDAPAILKRPVLVFLPVLSICIPLHITRTDFELHVMPVLSRRIHYDRADVGNFLHASDSFSSVNWSEVDDSRGHALPGITFCLRGIRASNLDALLSVALAFVTISFSHVLCTLIKLLRKISVLRHRVYSSFSPGNRNVLFLSGCFWSFW